MKLQAIVTQINQHRTLWIALIAFLHCCCWFIHYADTPLGASPSLDNQQTLLLAQQMATGELPAEPFHRAPLYPYLLSLFLSAGASFELLPFIARLLNAAAVVTSAAAISITAFNLWKSNLSAWITGLLIGLNPVLLFFAGDAFDILLATAALCLALHAACAWLQHGSLKSSLSIGIFLSLGAALRSHLLPLAILWPLVAAVRASQHRLKHFALAVIPLLFGFLLLGLANLNTAGEFRMLPWQGAYNLWTGNGPDVNGRIYTQTIRVEYDGAYDNPAKLESLELYQAETGQLPPFSISAMNAHWKAKTIEHIRAHPAEWLALMFRKAYYFLNNYEQYDNKTYGFHKRLHTQLRVNPIHWGLLLLLAVAGVLIGTRQQENRAIIYLLIGIFACYAAGTILFYTPNRFRVPMIPLLALLSGGIVQLKGAWQHAQRTWRINLVACLVITTGITYSGAFDAHNTNTWEEDAALLANASLRINQDTEAIAWATQALQMNPSRSDMSGVIVQAHFNQWALSSAPPQISEAKARTLLAEALQNSEANKAIKPIVGIYQWKLGRQDQATATWQSVQQADPFARLCLLWVGHQSTPNTEELKHYANHKHFPLLLAAVSSSKNSESGNAFSKTLDAILAPVTLPPLN
ncbi:MAG: hypothetical protein ACSHX8_01905 [Opitutaceae bacterium]